MPRLFTPPPLPCASTTRRIRQWGLAAVAGTSLLLAATLPAQAERADRSKPMSIESNGTGVFDMRRRVVVYQNNVVVQQGTLTIRAERVELRELSDRRVALALGAPGKPVNFRQKREGVNETFEGSAERVEYDDLTDTVKFIGGATVRRMRGTVVADEVTGAQISYDNRNEVFSVDGGVASSLGASPAGTGAAAPGAASALAPGRSRVVLEPRQRDAEPQAPAASAAGAR